MIEGLGFVYTENGRADALKKKLLRGVVSVLYRFALQRAHSVIFLNADDIRDFESWNLVDAGKAIELGGIGVDLEEWVFAPPVTDPIQFIFIGRLLREKGVEQFVGAARQLKNKYPDVEFVVLGNVDSNPGALKLEQVNKWSTEGVIQWLGHVPVKPWLERSSVFVLPSYREGVPRSTQEAMAMGRAVITTDVPGCRQTVDVGVNGFLVPVRAPGALAKAMTRFVENPELIAKMGFESRRIAEERFDVHKINQRLMTVLGAYSDHQVQARKIL